MQQFLIETEGQEMTRYLEREVVDELQEAYGEYVEKQNAGIAASLRRIYIRTKKKFVFLIDEWDCVMRERQIQQIKDRNYTQALERYVGDILLRMFLPHSRRRTSVQTFKRRIK